MIVRKIIFDRFFDYIEDYLIISKGKICWIVINKKRKEIDLMELNKKEYLEILKTSTTLEHKELNRNFSDFIEELKEKYKDYRFVIN